MPLKIKVNKFELDIGDVWCSEEQLKQLGPGAIKNMLFDEDLLSFIEEIRIQLKDSMEIYWRD